MARACRSLKSDKLQAETKTTAPSDRPSALLTRQVLSQDMQQGAHRPGPVQILTMLMLDNPELSAHSLWSHYGSLVYGVEHTCTRNKPA